MFRLLNLTYTALLLGGCFLQTSNDREEDEDEAWPQIEGSWGIEWQPYGFQYETSCLSNQLSNNYFTQSIGRMDIAALFDNTVVVEVDDFPEEIPCNLGSGAQYIGSCLDQEPYSTKMQGRMISGTSFTAQKSYGGMLGSEYIEWELELEGTRYQNQLEGSATMKIIEGDADGECRTQAKQAFTAPAW